MTNKTKIDFRQPLTEVQKTLLYHFFIEKNLKGKFYPGTRKTYNFIYQEIEHVIHFKQRIYRRVESGKLIPHELIVLNEEAFCKEKENPFENRLKKQIVVVLAHLKLNDETKILDFIPPVNGRSKVIFRDTVYSSHHSTKQEELYERFILEPRIYKLLYEYGYELYSKCTDLRVKSLVPYIEGTILQKSLHELNKHNIKPAISNLIKQVLQLHAENLRYVDFKLDNIIYHLGRLYLIDFDMVHKGDQRLYHARGCHGTMPPEFLQLFSCTVTYTPSISGKSDLFSLGVILLMILTKDRLVNFSCNEYMLTFLFNIKALKNEYCYNNSYDEYHQSLDIERYTVKKRTKNQELKKVAFTLCKPETFPIHPDYQFNIEEENHLHEVITHLTKENPAERKLTHWDKASNTFSFWSSPQEKSRELPIPAIELCKL